MWRVHSTTKTVYSQIILKEHDDGIMNYSEINKKHCVISLTNVLAGIYIFFFLSAFHWLFFKKPNIYLI